MFKVTNYLGMVCPVDSPGLGLQRELEMSTISFDVWDEKGGSLFPFVLGLNPYSTCAVFSRP
jgi:hypothetical protein